MKEFEYYLEKGVVKKVSIDMARTNDLIEEAERKFKQIERVLDKIGVDDENTNDIIKDSYDVLVGLIRAKMFSEGFSASGFEAHEGEVSFLHRLKFKEQEIDFIQKLRYFRNGVMYYGKRFDAEYAEKVIIFTKDKFEKLKNILNSNK